MTSSLSQTNTSRYVTRDLEILQGEPIIAATQVAVRDIVVLWKSGIKPEEIPQKLLHLVTAARRTWEKISVSSSALSMLWLGGVPTAIASYF